MNNPDILFDPEVQRKGAEVVKKWNKITADLIGINQAARTTVVKPSGNASVLLGTASGIHGEHSPRYIRHVQMNKEMEVPQLIAKSNPAMVETSVWTDLDYTIGFPIEPQEGSIYKADLLGVKQLEYVKNAQDNWIEHGTNKHLCVKPFLKHNVSNTITVDDWQAVTDYIYDNRASLCGISLLSAAGDRAYPQAPFTEVYTEDQIVNMYGPKALFASGLIEAGLNAFNNDLWTACNTAQGFGETLTDEHKDLHKRDFVRRFKKFSKNFLGNELTEDDWTLYNNVRASLTAAEEAQEIAVNDLDALLNVSEKICGYAAPESLIEEMRTLVQEAEDTRVECQDDYSAAVLALVSTKVYEAKSNARERCSNCLKDVYNLHKWWKITNAAVPIDWVSELSAKKFVDVDTLGSQGCSGGNCEITF